MKHYVSMALSILLTLAIFSCLGGGAGRDTGQPSDAASSNRGHVDGVAAIFDGDRALARDRAIDDARNKLVEKILGATVSGRSVMKDYRLVSLLVESRSRGLVKNETIIDEASDADLYRVTIEGTVEEAVVMNAIEEALNRYGRPRIMVLIREKFEGRSNLPGFTETETVIQDIMGRAGFEFVDARTTRDLMERQKAKMARAMEGRLGEDVQNLLLEDAGAEVIITGTAETHDQTPAIDEYRTGMQLKSAIVRIKAIDAYTGAVLAATSVDAPGMYAEPTVASKKAIEHVMNKALGSNESDRNSFRAGTFVDALIRKFTKAATNRRISILVTGLDYPGLKKLRDGITHRVRGVHKVIDRGRVGSAARIDVYFAGLTSDFVDELKEKESQLGFLFTVPESFPGRVVLTALPADPGG